MSSSCSATTDRNDNNDPNNHILKKIMKNDQCGCTVSLD